MWNKLVRKYVGIVTVILCVVLCIDKLLSIRNRGDLVTLNTNLLPFSGINSENAGSHCSIVNTTTHTSCDLRIIIITFDRKHSLLRLLESLNKARYGGDSVVIDIWVDRYTDGAVSMETVEAASSFKFVVGACNINIQRKHVGIRGQWLDVSSVSSSFTFNSRQSIFVNLMHVFLALL